MKAERHSEISELLQNEARPHNSSTQADAFNPVNVSTAWKFMNNSLFAPGTQRGKVMRRRAHTSEAHSDYIREKIRLLQPMFKHVFLYSKPILQIASIHRLRLSIAMAVTNTIRGAGRATLRVIVDYGPMHHVHSSPAYASVHRHQNNMEMLFELSE